VALSGTLFVPASWTTSGFVLDIAPVDLRGRTEKDRRHLRVDQMTQRPGPPGWYCWNAGKLLAATYTFRIEQAGFVRRFKIAAPGCEPVALVLPEAARLHVRLVDEADRKPVYVTSLAWCPAMPSWQSDASSIALSFDAESLRYSACVPIGFGYVTASDADHWLLDGDAAMAEIEAGERELVIPATRGCGVVVELLCHGERVDYPDELLGDAAIKAVGHGGGGAGTSLVDAHLEFPVTAPGRYLVTLPPIDGYAAVTPFEVEVPAGQFVHHPIEMTRNR
jgi:hypothetical protein